MDCGSRWYTGVITCTLPIGHTGLHHAGAGLTWPPAKTPTEQLGRVEALTLEPGDVLVFTAGPGVALSEAKTAEIYTAVRAHWPDHAVMFVEGVTLSVLRAVDNDGT